MFCAQNHLGKNLGVFITRSYKTSLVFNCLLSISGDRNKPRETYFLLFLFVQLFFYPARILYIWFIRAKIYKEPFSQDQEPAVSLNQLILRETMGGRKLSTWTAGYEKRMQRLSHLNQRLQTPISQGSLFWWCW